MRSILANFPTEQILFHKQSGETFEVKALVGSSGINTEDTSISIEIDDYFERTIPSGSKEYYIVTDPGFHKGTSGIPDHYQTKVKMVKRRPFIIPQREKQKLIFISHSSYDKEYVKAFVDAIFAIGLNEDDIVCSSYPGLGIPLGGKIFDWLAERFQEYDLHVIYFLSDNYYRSAASLNEMGAAWVMKQKWDAILLPGFPFSKIDGCIDPRQISISFDGDREELNHYLGQLKDRFIDEFGLRQVTDTRWEKIRNELVEKIRGIVPLKPNETLVDGKTQYIPAKSNPDRNSISVYACVMLSYAAADNGQVMIVSNIDGNSYQAGKAVMERNRTPRELAVWDDAVGQLIAKGYIKKVDDKGLLYQVTNDGFNIEEDFRSDSNLDLTKTPTEILAEFGDNV